MTDTKYGSLIKRVKAILIDMLIIVGLGVAASTLISGIDSVPNYVKAIAFILIFILYDPLCTSFLGGTIGHFIMGLRVRRNSDESQKIYLHIAILRFLIKVFLGSISTSLYQVTQKQSNS
jgi:uncharacterized RDD family membrane protein YckC